MSTHPLVQSFYSRIWNSGDENIGDLLASDFAFRGSLGTGTVGIPAFLDYVRPIRRSLADYHCEIIACATEIPHAFARMRFSGMHAEPFRGFAPTGKAVHWEGAALFTFDGKFISSLWVLGDLAGLEAILRANAKY
jgi:predicted ester cyclase